MNATATAKREAIDNHLKIALDINGTRLLDPDEVYVRVGLKKTAIKTRERRGDFPKPVRLASNCCRYRESDIAKWLANPT